jgi:hypothetical protein
MKSLISFLLIFSIILNGCASTSAGTSATQQQQQQQQEITRVIAISASVLVLTTVICIFAVSASVKKAKAKQLADEAAFQACVGKKKADIYTLYGPPDNIVDNGQGDGGTILIYQTITTYGGEDGTAYTSTHRKLFYISKDNVVTAVKEDTR